MTDTAPPPDMSFDEWMETAEGKAALGLDDSPTEDTEEEEVEEQPVAEEVETEVETTEEETETAEPTEEPQAQDEWWRVPYKVVDDEGEVDLKSLSPEERRAIVQKARDYDRPGGALDKSAERKAQSLMAEQFEKLGFLERDPITGQSRYTDRYQSWLASQKQAPTQEPAKDERMERLAELRRKVTEDGDGAAAVEYADLVAEIKAEKTAAERFDALRKEREAERSERAAKEATDREVAEVRKRVEDTIAAVASKLQGPDGSKDEDAINEARQIALAQVIQTQDVEKGLQAIVGYADRYQARVERWKSTFAQHKPKKKAPPVVGGGPSIKSAGDDFDPNDPFKGSENVWKSLAGG